MRKYPDFNNYRMDMIEIAKKHPNISAEDAYLLAKAKAGGRRSSTPRNRSETATYTTT